jgi:putative ABC transport system ATP-binding protein
MGALLSLDRVRKTYWRGLRESVVLAEVSLRVDAGKLVAIWGQRGSGKTTLAKVAAGLEQPDDGSVRFAGADLTAPRGATAPLLHDGIAWVQRAGPASDEFRSVLDYVVLPLLGKYSPRGARRRASATLNRVGVGDCAAERWASLTDGERTLVAIAHAFAREPRLLIADDPTVSLNVLQREEVMGLLRVAADEGLGILITVPDMPEFAHADQIASLSEGRLVLGQRPAEDDENVVKVDFPRREQSA